MAQRFIVLACLISLPLIFGCKISGTISKNGSPIEGITVVLTGDVSMSVTTDNEGKYIFPLVKPGMYTVTPSLTGYTFYPSSQEIALNNKNIDGITEVDFAITSVAVPPETLPEETGPYKVGYYHVTYTKAPYGTYTATIRYPAFYNGLSAPPDKRGALYPGIVAGNGILGAEWNITWIPEHLASHGYVTICFTPPNPALVDITQWADGFLSGISKLIAENSLTDSPIYRLVDVEKIGAIGLSMGGGGCIEATGTEGSHIDVAVALAPAGYIKMVETETMAAAGNISVPIQIQEGNNDGILPLELVRPYYDAVISDETIKMYVEINGANHVGYIDTFFAILGELFHVDHPRMIAFEEQHRIARKYFTAWFQYYLKGLASYHPYLFGDAAEDDVHMGILSDLESNLP